MILPGTFEYKTGFDHLRQMLSENCLCELGRQWSEKLSFSVSLENVKLELDLTEELRQILVFEENFPQENYIDVTLCLTKIRTEGSYPEVSEVFSLQKSIATIKDIERFFRNPAISEKYKVVCHEISGLKYFPYIGERIDAIIDKQGIIKDNASRELRDIRTQIKQKQTQVTRRMQSVLRTARQDGLVDSDAEITLRNGRPVIPIAAGNKRMLNGLIHDESATGKTVFIEPGEVVALNNEIRELEYAERREIIKILIAFANDIRPYLDDLFYAYESLGRIDFLRAKAKLALQFNCVKPILKKTPGFIWKDAVHPLLFLTHSAEGKEIVPLNIELNERNRILVISGPNAGGKSVCLKTVGLLQYMLQCGLLVPMKENSEACLFNNIFIDIGDEQSLENDLSTYSSHLLNMKQFVKSADEYTLVLVDEFGSGTEPALGGAIAEAILDKINAKGSYGVITTHYANLKHFATDTPGIINGAMLFDTQKIKPLYQLSIGKPGSSFAIDIARNIGLPEEILKKAAEKVGDHYINYEKHLREIIRDKKYWEEKRQRIRKVERTLDELYAKYSSELEDIRNDKKQIMAQARHEAETLLKETNRNIERTIREIKESQAHKEKTRFAREKLEEYKQQINNPEFYPDEIDSKIKEVDDAARRLARHSKEINKPKVESNKKNNDSSISEFEVGDQVKMTGHDVVGEVLEVNENNIMVAFGSLITTTEYDKIELVSKADSKRKSKSKTKLSEDILQRKLAFKPEIDVRGMRGDEAVNRVQEFIDDAAFVGSGNLKILHGKGNGILRQLIRDYLKTLAFVKSIGDEHADRGGAGITLVELDL